jgi:esterase
MTSCTVRTMIKSTNWLSNFHYSVLGTNEKNRIVFVHGLMAFAANWRKIANRLENEYQCLIYDQRGHGRSFKPESGYTPEIFADDLNKITDELGWDSFHLVGHSMGGRNVMVFADRFPHKVRTLTIEDMEPDADGKAVDYYREMLEQIPVPFSTKEEIKKYFTEEFEVNFKSKEPMNVLSSFMQANLEEKADGPNAQKYDWRFSKNAVYEIVEEGRRRDRWLEVSNFKMPVLLIRGEFSHVLKQETFEKMQMVNPNITGIEISGTGHWVHYEKHEQFVQELKQFFQSHSD